MGLNCEMGVCVNMFADKELPDLILIPSFKSSLCIHFYFLAISSSQHLSLLHLLISSEVLLSSSINIRTFLLRVVRTWKGWICCFS